MSGPKQRESLPTSWETLKLLLRAVQYLAPFRGRVAVKLGLGFVSLLPMLFLPWPVKIVVDQVIESVPLSESQVPWPFFIEPLLAPLEGASPTEILLAAMGFQALLLVLVGAIGTGGRENDQAEGYLSSGHDTATQTENEANAGFSLTGGLLGYFDFRWTIRLVQDLNHYYRSQLFSRIQSLPMSAFDDESIGDALYRVMYDTPAITNGCFRILLTPVLSILMIAMAVGILQVVFGSHPTIVWSALALLPISLFGTLPFANALRRRGAASRVAGANTTSTVEEGMANMVAVQSQGGEDRERDRFDSDSWESFSAHRRVLRTVLLSIVIILVPIFWIVGNAFFYVIDMVIDGQLSRGDFGLFLTYFGIIAGASFEIGALWFRVQTSAAGLNRVFYLMDLPSEQDDEGATELQRIEEGIRVEGVSFEYPDGTRALADVDLDARIGKITALVGPAGAGKTTLAWVSCGYLQPSQGRVLVDGRDLREFSHASLRRQIAFVFQETALFDESVEDNLRLGAPEASETELRHAARMAGADDFIRALPDGYQTKLGRAGGKLSVGQKQRLSIARALVRPSPLLVLDEPTSALDPETERVLVGSMREASRDRAVLVIAHRLSTVREADEICFVEGGQIVERGNHAQLMALRDGAYRRYVDLQTRGAA
jgi:ABC-type multidrug transport system fused ATPase/permease subunit